jgi:hypothetical protein
VGSRNGHLDEESQRHDQCVCIHVLPRRETSTAICCGVCAFLPLCMTEQHPAARSSHNSEQFKPECSDETAQIDKHAMTIEGCISQSEYIAPSYFRLLPVHEISSRPTHYAAIKLPKYASRKIIENCTAFLDLEVLSDIRLRNLHKMSSGKRTMQRSSCLNRQVRNLAVEHCAAFFDLAVLSDIQQYDTPIKQIYSICSDEPTKPTSRKSDY